VLQRLAEHLAPPDTPTPARRSRVRARASGNRSDA
jgi:hypothetical protein